MGRKSRRKGANGERELAALIGAVKISRTGYEGPDLNWNGLTVEVKRPADPISKTLDTYLNPVDLVMTRPDRGTWKVYCELDTLLAMLEQARLSEH